MGSFSLKGERKKEFFIIILFWGDFDGFTLCKFTSDESSFNIYWMCFFLIIKIARNSRNSPKSLRHMVHYISHKQRVPYDSDIVLFNRIPQTNCTTKVTFKIPNIYISFTYQLSPSISETHLPKLSISKHSRNQIRIIFELFSNVPKTMKTNLNKSFQYKFSSFKFPIKLI